MREQGHPTTDPSTGGKPDNPAVQPRLCEDKECRKQLASNNRSGYCTQHRWPKNRPSVKPQFCGECGKQLRWNSKWGYCRLHFWVKNRPSVKPQLCKACRKTLKTGNQSGFCHDHLWATNRPSFQAKFCSAVVRGSKCGTKLASWNKSGVCEDHAYLRKSTRAAIRKWNKKHRQKLSAYQQKHYKKKKAELKSKLEELEQLKASSKPRSEQIAEAVERVIPRFMELMPFRRKPTKELLGQGLSPNEAEALHMPGSRTAKVAARYFIAIEMDVPFDTVAQYHKQSSKAERKALKNFF